MTGDSALAYQILRDALDPDPAVVWRSKPFAPPYQSLGYPTVEIQRDSRAGRFSWPRWRFSFAGRRPDASCCLTACC